MVRKTKATTISFKVSLTTINQINDLCNIYSVNKSRLIRTLIEMEHEKLSNLEMFPKKSIKNS